jgi:hypothetical protein
MSPAAYFEAVNAVNLSGPSCHEDVPIQEMFLVANATRNTQHDQALKQVRIELPASFSTGLTESGKQTALVCTEPLIFDWTSHPRRACMQNRQDR